MNITCNIGIKLEDKHFRGSAMEPGVKGKNEAYYVVHPPVVTKTLFVRHNLMRCFHFFYFYI